MAKAQKANKEDDAPKAKRGRKKDDTKLVAVTSAPVGHNSGQEVPGLVALMGETLSIDEQIKELNKAKRDIRNQAKTEFGVLAANWAHEIRLRKMDRDVRIQFEAGAHDLKQMLGYQIALDLQPHTVPRTEDELTDPSAPRDDIINRKG